jgi:hypothetical protein
MPPDEYLDRLGALIAAGRDEEALELADRLDLAMRPRLSPEQLDVVSGMTESAELAVRFARAVAERREGQAGPIDRVV